MSAWWPSYEIARAKRRERRDLWICAALALVLALFVSCEVQGQEPVPPRYKPSRQSTGNLDLRLLHGEQVTVACADGPECPACPDCPPPVECDPCPDLTPPGGQALTVVAHSDVAPGRYNLRLLGGLSAGEVTHLYAIPAVECDDCGAVDLKVAPGIMRTLTLRAGEGWSGTTSINIQAVRAITIEPIDFFECRRGVPSRTVSRKASRTSMVGPPERPGER